MSKNKKVVRWRTNEQNLLNGIATQFKSGEQAVENGRKGDIASAKKKRERKRMAEQMNYLLSLPVKDLKNKTILKNLGIDSENTDNQMMLLVAQFKKALNGDMQTFKLFQSVLEPQTSYSSRLFSDMI